MITSLTTITTIDGAEHNVIDTAPKYVPKGHLGCLIEGLDEVLGLKAEAAVKKYYSIKKSVCAAYEDVGVRKLAFKRVEEIGGFDKANTYQVLDRKVMIEGVLECVVIVCPLAIMSFKGTKVGSFTDTKAQILYVSDMDMLED